MTYTLTLAQVRKFACSSSMKRLERILPQQGRIDAAQARALGCTYSDIVFAAGEVAASDDALARRLVNFLNDNAKRVLHIWEARKPKDMRPRKAIEACDAWLRGEITEKEWGEVAWAARAAKVAKISWVHWVARAAWDALDAWDARAARAARAACIIWDAWAAWSASLDGHAFRAWQFDRLIYWLTEADPVPLPMPEHAKDKP